MRGCMYVCELAFLTLQKMCLFRAGRCQDVDILGVWVSEFWCQLLVGVLAVLKVQKNVAV